MATSTEAAIVSTPPRNRLIGPMPKIGIRPAIDGRRKGVRESLEHQTLEMAASVARLLQSRLRHANGLPVECVVPPACIGGVAEAAQTAALFEREGVGVSLTVSPCWCYGAETMDMNPLYPKAVWGFNGTERPGAVYLAAVLAAHNQKGLPAFGIYGRDVQDIGDTSIPVDVEQKLVRFARAGLAVATMRGKSYLSLGGTSMGIAGSIVDPDLFEDYLGMRVEAVDMTELVRRIEEGIYDREELGRALAWVKARCREGRDWNAAGSQRTRAQKDADWETSVKMAIITRDLMVGNPRLAEAGFGEEALGRNAILGGFQGQRHWSDHFPNGDFMEAILNSSFDWNGIREPFVFATENDSLNGLSMLFGHLLTGTAQIFADVRTYWSPSAVKRVTGHELSGVAAGGVIHLINSGRGGARRDGTADGERPPGHEALLGDHAGRGRAVPGGDVLVPGRHGLLPGRGVLLGVPDPGRDARARCRASTSSRASARCCRSPKAGRWTCRTPCTRPCSSAPTPPGPPTGSCRGRTGRAAPSATSTA